jgi:RNA polymerase sigma factor (sigma-70 family)
MFSAKPTPTNELTRRVGMDDAILLGRYVETGCQESFEQIVTRHSGWVFSLSLRAVRDRHLAEDVTQAVFLILARKAKTIRAGTPLSGWLFKASRFAVSDALKRRTRMKNRENRFAEFFKATAGADGGDGLLDSAVADDVSQTLDEAVACLSETDRQAILLRFFEGKSLAEVGAILGTSEEAAKKRVARAVERLRKYFASRGAIVPIAVLLLLLAGRSASAAGFVPATVFPAAAGHSLAQVIAEGALKLMAQAQAKLLGAIFAASLAFMVSIPTLGGAIAYITKPPPIARLDPATPFEISSPDSAYGTPEERRVLREEQSRFSDLWIAYKGQLLWRSDAYRQPIATPFLLRSAEKQDQPYAVAVDPKGNFFYRPLSQSILSAPAVRQAEFDYETGPFEPHARVRDILAVIEPRHGFDILPSAHSATAKVEDKDEWRKLNRVEEEDGTVIVEMFQTQLKMLGPEFFDPGKPENRNDFGYDNIVEVPEPATGLLALGAAALALTRRRRKQ